MVDVFGKYPGDEMSFNKKIEENKRESRNISFEADMKFPLTSFLQQV